MSAAVREFDRRVEPGLALMESAEEIARACHAMAARFHRGGKLLLFGNGGGATDAEHIAVEFVHPVIVGKIALPALSLAADPTVVTGIARREGFGEVFAHQVRQLADPVDIALGVSADGRCANVWRGLQVAQELGLLTVGLMGSAPSPEPQGGSAPLDPPLRPRGLDVSAEDTAVDHLIVVPSDDPEIVKEVHVTVYHVLWELVHVFFEHPGVLQA